MSNQRRTIALFILLAFAFSLAMPASMYSISPLNQANSIGQATPADSVIVVEYEILNLLDAYNDDDFKFTIYNATAHPDNIIALANVSIYYSNGTLYSSQDTAPEDGTVVFPNIPQGTFVYNVTLEHATGGHNPDVFKTGVIVSDGPDADVQYELGNLDWENDDDDFIVTVYDVEGNLATNLNFTIEFQGNGTIYNQTTLSGAVYEVWDIPEGDYTWKAVVRAGSYLGYIIDQGDFSTNGTQKYTYRKLGPIAGDSSYYDYEVIAYYETSLAPIPGVLVNVTYKNGTVIDARTTPSNGSLLFLDLPVAFINVSITYAGVPIELGYYWYNLTTSSTDLRPPTILGPSNISVFNTDTNVTLAWHLEDDYPDEIEVFVDGALNLTVGWTESSYDFLFNVSDAFIDFTIGVYELELVASDQNGNDMSDFVMVTIYENSTPVITGPEDIEFYFSETGFSIVWNVSDDYLNRYIVERDGTEIASGGFAPETPFVSVNLDGLAIGTYSYTLLVNDTSGNEATDTVVVTVNRDDVNPIITYSPSTISYPQGAGSVLRNWTATDDFKDRWTITVDGVLVAQGDWISEKIEFDFGGLKEGAHTVILTVYDLGGNSASSSVAVIVGSPILQLALIIAGIGVLAFALVAAVVWFVRYR
ncbi:MAG: hypothetical protein EAX95_13795 [Candidatus Thorarchaeota archaeon]|nr:hypothetical protein [Candidatus Thorarchaeota archaeon]